MFHLIKTTCIINLKLYSYFLQVETQILNIKPAFILPAVEIIEEECNDNKEEEEEGGSLEVISQMDTPALRVDDLPSDDEDFQLTQTTPEDNTENMEAGEPQKPSKEDRKRTRADSKSPPDSRTRKKSTK